MISNKHNYCFNCMNEIEEDHEFCPNCGKRIGEYVVNQRALPPMTILNGKYLIGRVLGEGGFGITYLALDMTLQLKVAIKEYFPIQFASRNAYESKSNDLIVINGKASELFRIGEERYEQEAQRLVKLEALPGIVRILNFLYENNTAYMVMEYVQGKSLKEYMIEHQNHVDWNIVLDLMRPVIGSLNILHKNGIIHRDISPDNIMVNENGQITLIDFGSAREVDDSGKSMTIVLKHGYAPPEQYQTHGNQGPWTDVYALCATMYYLISGSVPASSMERLDKKTSLKPLSQYVPGISRIVSDSINQGLSVDIKDRIHSMEELYNSLYLGRELAYKRRKKIIKLGIISSLIILLVPIYFGIKKWLSYIDTENTIQTVSEENTDHDHIYDDTSKDFFDDEMEPDEYLPDEHDDQEHYINDTAARYVSSNRLTYTNSDLINYTESESGIIITGTDNNLTEIVIPEVINGKPVVEIFGVGRNVTKLILPDTLIKIGDSAFRNCVYLEYIFIPSNVNQIGDGSFDNCFSLREIHVSDESEYFYVENGVLFDVNGNAVD